jgi:transcription termination/antitermination protein NusA
VTWSWVITFSCQPDRHEALAAEEELDEHQPAADLLELDGMDEATAYALAARGVVTRDDLADMATDELTDVDGIDEARAAALIMEARKHWFE